MEPADGTVFVYGPLATPKVQSLAWGRVPNGELAVACGWSLRSVEGHSFPVAVKDGQECAGQILTGLTDQEIARIVNWDAGWFTWSSVVAATSTLGPTITRIGGVRPAESDVPGLGAWNAETFDLDAYLVLRQDRAA